MQNTLSRTHSAARNLRVSAAGIFINLIFSFVSRKIFVLVLGRGFVGLGSLMGNITAVLSLVDFGAACAVTCLLYRPISENDFDAVSQYLCHYARLCRVFAAVQIAVGVLFAPALPHITDGFSGEKNLYTVFFIYIFTNASGYIFSRERVLLFADQKNYVNQLFSYFFGAVSVLTESSVLLFTKNYICYISVHALMGIAEDICIAAFVRKSYSCVDFSGKTKPSREIKRSLYREMLLLCPSNISGTLLRTADNFLVVWLFGVSTNGIYSNYNMLLAYASMLSVTLIGSLSASVGNLCAANNPAASLRIFSITSLCSFFLVNICACVLFVMSGDIITVWLGSGNALPAGTGAVLAIHFFISGIRQCTLIFRDAGGLYKKERIKPLLELAVSLFLSVFLGKKLGLCGVYLGQAASAFAVCMWYEPYILFRYSFSCSPLKYYLVILRYAAVCALSCFCSFCICRMCLSFSLRIVICVFVPALMFLGFFYGSETFDGALYAVKAYFRPGKTN